MMTKAFADRPPLWRNALIWTGLNLILYLIAIPLVFGMDALRGMGALGQTSAIMAAAMILASVLAGLGRRRTPVNPRNLGIFLAGAALVIALFAAFVHSMGASTGPQLRDRLGGTSAVIACTLGVVLTTIATLGLLMTTLPPARGLFLPAEQRETIAESRLMHLYGFLSIAALGLLLVLMSLAGAGGLVPPGIALADGLVLMGVQIATSLAVWPLLDELGHAISRETCNAGFYLITGIGGGWSMLAHLGFVVPPKPLDWLTLFTVMMLAAAYIANARRGLLPAQ